MSVDFTVLQQRVISLVHLDLSRTMDLCALITSTGSIVIYRTLSWEKVLTKSSAEISSSGSSSATCVSFCSTGRVVGIGFDDGECVVLDVETGIHIQSYQPSNFFNHAVSHVSWKHIEDTMSCASVASLESDIVLRAQMWMHGGSNLVERAGMEQVFDDQEQTKAQNKFSIFFHAAQNQLMISLRVNLISCYMYGIFPIYSIDVGVPDVLRCVSRNGLYGSEIILESCRQGFVSTVRLQCTTMVAPLATRWIDRMASLWLTIESDIDALLEMMSSLGRKWKDSTRTIVPKLALLQGLLDGYQITTPAIEFLHGIVLCGQWHPAAVAHFSQHWNDQGLARLKSAIDGTSKATLWVLQMRAIPVATNLTLRCRELLSIQSMVTDISRNRFLDVTPVQELVSCSELILFKLDETLHEARLARECMMAYIQFLKENSAAPDSPATPDLGMRPAYLRMFDPRRVRAGATGAKAEPECVTGTHLYAYLQDAPLPQAVVQDRSPSGGFAPLSSTRNGRRAADNGRKSPTGVGSDSGLAQGIQRIVQLAEESSNSRGLDPLEGVQQDDRGKTSAGKSLIQQLKAARTALECGFYQLHEQLSARAFETVHTEHCFQATVSTGEVILCIDTLVQPAVRIGLPHTGEDSADSDGDQEYRWQLENVNASLVVTAAAGRANIIIVCSGKSLGPGMDGECCDADEVTICASLIVSGSFVLSEVRFTHARDDPSSISLVGLCDDTRSGEVILFQIQCSDLNWSVLDDTAVAAMRKEVIITGERTPTELPVTLDGIRALVRAEHVAFGKESSVDELGVRVKQRVLPMAAGGRIMTSGPRGVVAAMDQQRCRLFVVDIEADDEVDDDDDDDHDDDEDD